MKYLASILITAILLLTACQTETSKKTKKDPKAKQTQTTAKKKAVEASKLVDKASSEELDFTQLLSTATKIEFLFYSDPSNPSISSISTETENVEQARGFAQYITNQEVENPGCVYMGSTLFKNPDGDILFDGEFNLSQECSHFKLLYNGKTSYRKLTPDGLQFLTQFYMMVTNQIKTQTGGGS